MKLTLLLMPLMVLAIIGLLYSGIAGNSADASVVKGDLVAAAATAQEGLAHKLEGVGYKYSRIQLTEAELRDFVLAGLADHEGGQKILELSNGIGARIVDSQIELRMLLNLANMQEGMSEDERKLFDQAVATSKMAEGRDVDISVLGPPSTSSGSLRLNPSDTTLKMAVLEVDLNTWVDRLGFERRDVDRLLRFKFPGYRVKTATMLEEAIELEVRKL